MASVPRRAIFGGGALRAHARPVAYTSRVFAIPSPLAPSAPTSCLARARQGATPLGVRWYGEKGERYARRSKRHDPEPAEEANPLAKVKDWTFEDIKKELEPRESESEKKRAVFIDVREPSELQETGWIPGAINIPITSAVQSFHLDPEDFKDMMGYERPLPHTPIVVYCKAGVRARAAAGLAVHAGFKDVGLYKGSWLDWERNEGPVSFKTTHYRVAEERTPAEVLSHNTGPSKTAGPLHNTSAPEDYGQFSKPGPRSYQKGSGATSSPRPRSDRSGGETTEGER
ncbi:Rhodanese domain-containing protein [Paramyrothecium foliicola]|nr:Rhodanese domain-containing protein [Paramyrothecium foliicola]